MAIFSPDKHYSNRLDPVEKKMQIRHSEIKEPRIRGGSYPNFHIEFQIQTCHKHEKKIFIKKNI